MPDEAALIDAPTEDVAAIDTAVETPEVSGESEGNISESEGNSQESGESLRGSALWREVKSLTQEGKPLTPKQLSALNKVIHANDAFSTKYPDGLKQIDGAMAAVKQLSDDESLPMDQVIAQTLEERNYFREFDNLFTNGKPEFVDKLAEASPEAFQNIAPAVFRKYAEVNPDGYSKYIAETSVQHMERSGVPMQFKIIEAFWPQVPDFPGKAQFEQAIVDVRQWTNNLKAIAAKQIEQKTIPNQKDGQQGPDLAAENAQLKMDNSRVQWNSAVRSEGVNFVKTEATKAAGKQILTEKEHNTVLAAVAEEMEARLTADRRYGEAMQGYLKAGNRSAYLQRIQSERKKLIPGAVWRAVADVIEGRPAVVKNPAQPVNGAVKKPTAPLAGAVQYRRIAGHPKTLGMTVDLGKTTHSMLERRQAITTTGDKVTWGPMAKK